MLTTLLKLGLLGFNIFKDLILAIIRSFFNKFIQQMNNYLNNIKGFTIMLSSNLNSKVKSKLALCIPLDAFSYIRKNPKGIHKILVFISSHISVYNLYTSLITVIKYFYRNRMDFLNYRIF